MPDYHEQTELRRYLWSQFSVICNDEELKVYKANQGRLKARSAPKQDTMLRKMFGDWDEPQIVQKLNDGFDAFSDQVLERINQDYPELFYINRCESCSRIVTTPKACICGWCGHSWFDRREYQDKIANEVFQQIKQKRENKSQ
jgi:hypothetical protein